MEPPCKVQRIAFADSDGEAASPFDSLPAELWLQILSIADIRELGRISRVCRALNSLASQDSLWRPIAERIVGWHHEKITKPSSCSWKEHCRRFVSPPTHVEQRLVPVDDLVRCPVQIGQCFYGTGDYGPVAQYPSPVCRTSAAMKSKPLLLGIDQMRRCTRVGNYVGCSAEFSGGDDESKVTLFDADLNEAGHIADTMPLTLDNFVRWHQRQRKLELVTLDGRVLNTHTLRHPISDDELLAGAATSDRFGFLVGGAHSLFHDLADPVYMLLFDRDLVLVATVEVLTVADIGETEDYFLPDLYSVADRLVVFTKRDLYQDVLSSELVDFVAVSFSLFSLPSRAKRTIELPKDRKTIELPAVCKAYIDVLVHADRVFVSTQEPRVYCFSADAELLWTCVGPNWQYGNGWEIYYDGKDLFLVGIANQQDAHVLRFLYDPPSSTQAQGLLVDG
eukprot:TRINITY_DN14619_c0_g1_i1.p1 TRINITY_DN14619_c0_g1~~TRINITY_DN14619_c0_g1_i1.p1  ORF type:complete len:450 (+),score=76.10 TRINITY_DN14619_c0_g1_i1:182-1531(+)